MELNKEIKNIDHLTISGPELKKLQLDLIAREFESFNEVVKRPIEKRLPQWISEEYPDMLDDTADLSKGVFRRLKNDIKKSTISSTHLDLSSLALKYLRVECELILPTEKNIKNNFGLTKGEFKKLVEELKAGNETIIEKVYLGHFEKCVAIVAKHNGCTQELAYECTMDALIEIRTDLQKGRISYGNLESYFTFRAMKKYYKKGKKKKIAEQPLFEGLEFQDHSQTKDKLIEKDLNRIVKEAIKNLCDECRQILFLFYYQDLKMTEIGVQMNKSHEAVRKQASRCREKLKKSFGKQFYEQFSNHFF